MTSSNGQKRIPEFEEELRLEQYEKMAMVAPEVAVIFADKYCELCNLIKPDWVTCKAVSLVQQYVKPRSPRPVGRATGAMQRYVQDIIHFARWDEVVETRNAQTRLREERDKLKRYAGKRNADRLLPRYEEKLQSLGHTLLHAFEYASVSLEGTPAFGGPEAIKASYYRMKLIMKDPFQARRCYIAEYEIMKELGDEQLNELMQGTKPL